jgi:hypothetical protein
VSEELEKFARCWEGYEPVPGKEAYSEDSCRPKKKTRVKKAEAPVPQLQTSVPNENPAQFLSRVRQNKFNLPKFIDNAKAHEWRVGVPGGNSLIQNFLNKSTPDEVRNKIQSTSDDTLLKVINKNPAAFRGVQNQDTTPMIGNKMAFDVSSMPVNENILPNISAQSKWKYARTKDGLRLSDGNLVYTFGGFPESFPAEDLRVNRLKDDNILDFEKDSIGKGTAQVHRSSPDNIYMTLADGGDNPTFMLQHEEGQNWRYSPSKKFLAKLQAIKSKTAPASQEASKEAPVEYENALLLDPESLLKGAEDFCKQAFDPSHPTLSLDSTDLSNLIKTLGYGASAVGTGFTNTAREHPLATGTALYGLASGVSSLRDMINPERKIERELDPSKKRNQILANLAAAAIPTIGGAAIAT